MVQSAEYRKQKRRLKRHIDAIAASDQDVARAVADVGYPEPRLRDTGFETFLSIIVSQQVSTEAAASIWQKVSDTLPKMTPKAVAGCKPELLRGAGLSGRKVEYAQGLAQAILNKEFNPDELPEMSDEEVVKQIVELRGFGSWSAEIYLMFSLQRQDVFAADDLALQIALQRLKGLNDKPSGKQARQLVEHWSPRRTAGSLFLWHYYRGAPA